MTNEPAPASAEAGPRASATARLGLLASLYFSQGLPFGFFTQALPVVMRVEGRSLEQIGLTGLLAVAWGLKFLLAPFVDRGGSARFGKRRSFIVPLQLASTLLFAALAFAAPASGIAPLVVGALVANFCAATQDIATDALAVDLLPEGERGLGNGLQVAGYRVGMIVGGGAMLWVFARVGFRAGFVAMAATLLVATLPVLAFREGSPATKVAAPERGAYLAALRSLVSRPGAASWIVLLVVYKAGESLAAAMVRPWLVDAGLDLAGVGLVLGTFGFAAGVAGALAGGVLAGRVGRHRALVAFGAAQSLGLVGYALAATRGSQGALAFAVAFEHLTSGMATAALFTAMMDACEPDRAATDYTVQSSIVVVATGVASLASGRLAHLAGYPRHFALAALVSFAATLFVVARRRDLESLRAGANARLRNEREKQGERG